MQPELVGPSQLFTSMARPLRIAQRLLSVGGASVSGRQQPGV